MTKPNTYRTTIQSERILRLLRTAAGSWVPLPEIQACAAQYNARIFELRKRGFRIENRTELVDDSRHSWFRLLPGDTRFNPSPKPAPPEQPSWEDRPRVTGLPLFDMVHR
jgi:hypothetical protein